MSYKAGTAFVTVSPSFRGWQTKVAAWAKTLKPVKIPTEFDEPKTPLIYRKPPVKVPVDLDEGSFERNVRGKIEAALKALPKAQIGAATNEAEQKLRDLRVELETLNGKKIGVDISDADALAELERIRVNLDELRAASPNIQVKADTLEAATQLLAVKAMADDVARARPTVTVNAKTGGAMSQLAGFKSFLSGLPGGVMVRLGVVASPLLSMLAPILGSAAGGLAGLGTLGAAGIGGGLAFAGIGGLALKGALNDQKALTKATKDRKTAVQQLQNAENSLASAVESADRAQVSAARQVADAERALADAHRSADRAIQSAQEQLANARRNQARSAIESDRAIQSAEEQLAQARENQARVAVQAERDIQSAQEQLVNSQEQVRRSLEQLHAAREQAARDLEDLTQRTKDDALNQEQAEISLIDAQNQLNTLEQSGTASALDLRKARLAVAEAEQQLVEVRIQSKRDAEDLAKAEKDGINGSGAVKAAQQQLDAAKQNRADAKQALADARANAAQARKDAARQVADARRQLAQARADARRREADAAREVADARRQLAQTRADAARQIADAERNVSRARADAAASEAAAARQVAHAQAQVAAAQGKVAAADRARAKALDKLGPAQERAIRGVHRLKAAWADFLKGPAGRQVLGALVVGMHALTKALPGVAAFIKPVARGFREIFSLAGDAASSKGFREFGHLFGQFAGGVIRDAGRGALNLAKGFGSLLQAFMPLAGSMSGGLVNLTHRFAEWAATVSKSKGFHQFIDYTRENGPIVLHIIAELAKLFVKVLIAVSPIGVALLKLTDKVVTFLASLNPSALAGPVANVIRYWTPISKALAKPIDDAKKWIHDRWHDITGFFSAATAWVTGDWKSRWNKVQDVIFWPLDQAVGQVKKGWGWVEDRFTAAKNWVTGPFRSKWNQTQDVVFSPLDKARAAIGRGWDWIQGRFTDAKDWVTGAFKRDWEALKGIVTDPVQAAKGIFQNLLGKGGSIRGIFSDAVDALGGIWDGLRKLTAKPIKFVFDVVNKLVDAFDWVSDAVGGPHIKEIPIPGVLMPKSKSNPQGYSDGGFTGWGGRLEPAGIVHRGEFVTDQETTRRAFPLLSLLHRTKGRVLGYDGGGLVGGALHKAGSFVGDLFKGFASAGDWLKSLISKPLQSLDRLKDTQFGRLVAHLPSVIVSAMVKQVEGLGQSLLGMVGIGGGGPAPGPGSAGGAFPAAVTRWAPLILQVLKMFGLPKSWLPAGEHRMMVESGGNPTIVNKWDSNWLAGTPSVGLLQVIGPTFSSYAGPYRKTGPFLYGVSTNPLANIYAGVNYALHRYGVPFVGGTAGYDAGGLAATAGVMVKGPAPERVLSPAQTAAFERALNRGFGAGDVVTVELTPAQLTALASRQISVKLGTREVAESVRDYGRDRRLHGEPGW